MNSKYLTYAAILGALVIMPASAHDDDDDGDCRGKADSAVQVDCDKPCRHHDDCCENNRSGSGGFAPQVLWLDEAFMQKIKNFEPDLKDRQFAFDRNYSFQIGGIGYSDVKKTGLRVGGGWWAGYKKYESDEFTRVLPDTSSGDSIRYDAIIALRVIPIYGGFVAEKAFQFPGWNVFAGGLFGGGVYLMHKQVLKSDDIFVSTDNDSLNWRKENNAIAVAPFIAGDLHAGTTVSLAPRVHIALEGVLLLTYSPNGFVTNAGNSFGDFTTFSPGVRMRFIFGKAA